LSSTNVKSIVAEEESVTVATIRFDYDYEHRPPRRTEHEHDEIRC
jgi:sugar (pentulose or hexulose) kinase